MRSFKDDFFNTPIKYVHRNWLRRMVCIPAYLILLPIGITISLIDGLYKGIKTLTTDFLIKVWRGEANEA